jgi:hypothetical protein
MKNKLTQGYLKECLHYDPETGIFTWNERPESHFKTIGSGKAWNTKYANEIAGSRYSKTGYTLISINYTLYYAHRLAFLYVEGYIPENHVDHIDKNKLNNQWDNLREVSVQCNLQNSHLSSANTSGVTGVYWEVARKKWVAQITISIRNFILGRFDRFEDAVMRRYKEEVENPNWTCSIESSAYKYLKDNNLLEDFSIKDFTSSDIKSNNISGVCGVWWRKHDNVWYAYIRSEGKSRYLGSFKSFNDAVMRRYQAELENPAWRFKENSSSYKYLKDHNLI